MRSVVSAYTLFEVMVVLCITVVLSAISVSGLSSQVSRSRDESLRISLIQFLNHAQHQSEILHRTITLCKSADQHHCGGEWSDGLLLFVDDGEDGIVRDESQILSVQPKIANGTLHVRFFIKEHEYLSFHPLISASQDNGTFWYCHASAQLPVWAVRINRMGGVTGLLPDKQGEIKDASGHPLVC